MATNISDIEQKIRTISDKKKNTAQTVEKIERRSLEQEFKAESVKPVTKPLLFTTSLPCLMLRGIEW